MRYHGNYCGPNWSAGEYQASVISDVPALDDFDSTCKEHDAVYAMKGDLSTADDKFYNDNIGKDVKRTVAALLVKGQQLIRDITRDNKRNTNDINQPNKIMTNKTNKSSKPSLRGAQPSVAKQNGKSKEVALSTVPAAYGFTLKLNKPVVTRNGNHATITGSDFASSVYLSNSSDYQPAASVAINPTFFNNAMLGSMARAYSKYRLKAGYVEYIPSVATSTSGQIIMCINTNIKEPFINGSSTSFLSRALSNGNAIATPVWREAKIDLLPDNEWRPVDVLLDADIDDGISQEVQVYALATSTSVGGILLYHYAIEFMDPIFTFHPTMIPNPYGNGNIISFTDDSAVNATTDAIRLTNSSLSTFVEAGSIFRLIFMQARSTLPTGPATWADAAKIATELSVSTTTNASVSNIITMVTGTVLYGARLNSGGDFLLFGSYDAAQAGLENGQILYQTATTATGTWTFIAEMVRMSHNFMLTSQ